VAIEILGMMLAGAGASYGWWQLQRRRQTKLGRKTLESAFDGDVSVAWGVAVHEVTSRGHTSMWPLHLVYGMLQVETFTDAIRKIGGNPDAIENRVMGALDAAPKDDAKGMEQVGHLLSYTYAVAHHYERKITLVDLWARLASLDVAKLLELEAHELLFLLVHGMAAPEADLPGRTDVHVILRNDDFTTQQFVTEILRDVFQLSEADAHTRMMETHTQGKTIVGRFKLAAARDKVIASRSKARAQMFPFWIALEDC
jgi:ATP-dependent Clp protease adaptor protein ClpS